MFVFISTLVLIIIALGLVFRHNRRIHIPLMSAAFIIDLSLVLIIELQRQAIENVIVNNNLFVWFHVSVSSLVLVTYIVLAITGSKISKIPKSPELYQSKLIKIHKLSSILFVILRLTNYVTSLSMPVEINL